jgi:hypothetical protein
VSADRVEPVDAFELPDWLGEREVVWTTEVTVGTPLVPGRLEAGADSLACDLLACDRAYPEPVLPERWRREAHSSWALGQVLLADVDARLTLVVPGVAVSVDSALEALRRLARAVGVRPETYAALIRL